MFLYGRNSTQRLREAKKYRSRPRQAVFLEAQFPSFGGMDSITGEIRVVKRKESEGDEGGYDVFLTESRVLCCYNATLLS